MLKRVLTSATVLMSLSLAGCQSMTELERELSASLDLEVRILAQDHDRCAGGQLVRWLEEYRRLMPIDQVRFRSGLAARYSSVVVNPSRVVLVESSSSYRLDLLQLECKDGRCKSVLRGRKTLNLENREWGRGRTEIERIESSLEVHTIENRIHSDQLVYETQDRWVFQDVESLPDLFQYLKLGDVKKIRIRTRNEPVQCGAWIALKDLL